MSLCEVFKPHDYQKEAINWGIEHEKCGLFLPMGAGKTVTTLTIISKLIYLDVSNILIIGPKRVVESTWIEEIKKWEHTKWMSYELIDAQKAKGKKEISENKSIYLVSKDNVKDLVLTLGRKWKFDMVVIDELSCFKNPRSKRFRALRTVLPLVKRLIGLTGTPAPNGIADLWSQVYLFDRGDRLGKTLTAFRSNFLVPGRRNGYTVYDWKPQEDAEERIYRKLGDLCMSIRESDCVKLPELTMINQRVCMNSKTQAEYRKFKTEKVLSCENEEILAANAGVLCNYLLQFTSGEIYTEDKKNTRIIHDNKLSALEDLMISANGHPVIVFYYYKHELKRITEHFKKDYKIGVLDDSESIKKWNDGKFDMLLVHPASAGHGLNLQNGGHIAIWYTLPNWNLELYLQANARIYRQGQKNATVIYHIITKDTIEEDMLKALEDKDVSQKRLISALRKQEKREKE